MSARVDRPAWTRNVHVVSEYIRRGPIGAEDLVEFAEKLSRAGVPKDAKIMAELASGGELSKLHCGWQERLEVPEDPSGGEG